MSLNFGIAPFRPFDRQADTLNYPWYGYVHGGRAAHLRLNDDTQPSLCGSQPKTTSRWHGTTQARITVQQIYRRHTCQQCYLELGRLRQNWKTA